MTRCLLEGFSHGLTLLLQPLQLLSQLIILPHILTMPLHGSLELRDNLALKEHTLALYDLAQLEAVLGFRWQLDLSHEYQGVLLCCQAVDVNVLVPEVDVELRVCLVIRVLHQEVVQHSPVDIGLPVDILANVLYEGDEHIQRVIQNNLSPLRHLLEVLVEQDGLCELFQFLVLEFMGDSEEVKDIKLVIVGCEMVADAGCEFLDLQVDGDREVLWEFLQGDLLDVPVEYAHDVDEVHGLS